MGMSSISKRLLAATAAIFASCSFVLADDFDKRFFADAGLSTLGASAQAGVYILPRFAARMQGNAMSMKVGYVAVSSLTAKGKLKTTTVGLLGDYHFNDSDFFLSGGIYFNDTTVTASAPVDIVGSVEINGNTYTAADIGMVRGRVEYDNFSPYLGAGYRKTFSNGLKIGFEAGVMHLGKPDITLDAEILNASLASAIQTDLDAERANFRAEYERDISKLRFAPIMRLSVGMSF